MHLFSFLSAAPVQRCGIWDQVNHFTFSGKIYCVPRVNDAEEDDGEIDDDEGKNYDVQYESFVSIIKQISRWNSLFYSQEIVLKWWQ